MTLEKRTRLRMKQPSYKKEKEGERFCYEKNGCDDDYDFGHRMREETRI